MNQATTTARTGKQASQAGQVNQASQAGQVNLAADSQEPAANEYYIQVRNLRQKQLTHWLKVVVKGSDGPRHVYLKLEGTYQGLLADRLRKSQAADALAGTGAGKSGAAMRPGASGVNGGGTAASAGAAARNRDITWPEDLECPPILIESRVWFNKMRVALYLLDQNGAKRPLEKMSNGTFRYRPDQGGAVVLFTYLTV